MQDPENILVHSSANAGEHATPLAGVAVGCTQDSSEAYDKIDCYLRDTMDDVDYAEYSAALELVYRGAA